MNQYVYNISGSIPKKLVAVAASEEKKIGICEISVGRKILFTKYLLYILNFVQYPYITLSKKEMIMSNMLTNTSSLKQFKEFRMF